MTLSENFHVMSMPGYGPWARLAYFRGSSEKGERVRGRIVPLLAWVLDCTQGQLYPGNSDPDASRSGGRVCFTAF